MKKLILVLLPWVFILFVGCSGDNSGQTPPLPPGVNASDPNVSAMMQNLQNQALVARQDCTQTFAPVFIGLAVQALQQQRAQQPMIIAGQPLGMGGGYPLGAAPMPVSPMSGASAIPAPAQPAGMPQCSNDLMNFLMTLKTIMLPSNAGKAAIVYANTPQGQQYATNVLSGIGARVSGAAVGTLQQLGASPTQIQSILPQLQMAGVQYTNQLLSSAPPSIAGPVTTQLAANGINL